MGEIAPCRTWYSPLNSAVRSRARTSSGSSTTHRRVVSRPGSRQMLQSGWSLMLKQRSQKTTWSRTATSAAASVRASASGARSRWYVSRCAVFGPTPGSLANASISRATGSIRVEPTKLRLQPGDPEAARDGRHLLLGEPARGGQGIVHRGDDEVLEHVDVGRIDRRRVDRNRDELLLARDDGLHDATTRGAVDVGVTQLTLD